MEKYEVKVLKKIIINGEPIGLCLILCGSEYRGIVEFNYFTNDCNIIDMAKEWASLKKDETLVVPLEKKGSLISAVKDCIKSELKK